jgi:dolichol-phosphate mannosyltransferase
MHPKPTSLAVIAPFYNEAGLVDRFYQALCAALDPLGLACTFVFVDDGSSDATLLELNQLADADPRVTVLSLTRNFGHQIALTAGLDYADADVVITMDSDLQHPPAVIPEMLRLHASGVDVIYGVRKNEDNRGYIKRLTAKLFYRLLRRFTHVDIIGGAMDFRLMSRRAVAALRQMPERHRFLRGMVPWMGFPFQTLAYDEQQRVAGQSKYTWRKMLRLARHGFFSFSTAALDMITLLGIFMAGAALLYLIYALLAWVFVGRVVPGWTSVITVVLIVSGVQLISIGILAQYIGMIFEQVKGRPLYFLKQERLAQQPANQAARQHETEPG